MLNKILVVGAGRSATSLIDYLLEQAPKYQWEIIIADADLALAEKKLDASPQGKAVALDVLDAEHRGKLVQEVDVVVSMLPPFMHHHLAGDCLKYGKHLANASYVAPELKEMAESAQEKGLIFLCELGLDPGIDHMSAMQGIHQIQEAGHKITSFKSAAGGLVAPESDDNPWHYKFSWSPRNVVLAGQGIAKYMHQGQYKHVPYQRLFEDVELVEVPGMGQYEAYPNRISLKYESAYGLEGTPTILRQTLRYPGYCKAWNLLLQLGLTDDSHELEYSENLTYASLLRSFLPAANDEQQFDSLRGRLAHFFKLPETDEALDKLDWLGLFEETPIPFDKASPAVILQDILEKKWKLQPEEKDMIIMQHEFIYQDADGQEHRRLSTMIQTGDNAEDTAMARLVGLPLAMGVKQIMLGQIERKGVLIPIHEEIYTPILQELESYGVIFQEREECLSK